MAIRTGIGFDAHRFAEGRDLVLGGLVVPHARGLEGHSDADVLCHAIMDALLGAVADGDIGQHFPDTDPTWRDACSLTLLNCVGERLKSLRAKLVNVDVTVMAERPVLAPHIAGMREKVAGALALAVGRISIKATTVEKMGAIGREEGIAALALATVDQEEEE